MHLRLETKRFWYGMLLFLFTVTVAVAGPTPEDIEDGKAYMRAQALAAGRFNQSVYKSTDALFADSGCSTMTSVGVVQTFLGLTLNQSQVWDIVTDNNNDGVYTPGTYYVKDWTQAYNNALVYMGSKYRCCGYKKMSSSGAVLYDYLCGPANMYTEIVCPQTVGKWGPSVQSGRDHNVESFYNGPTVANNGDVTQVNEYFVPYFEVPILFDWK